MTETAKQGRTADSRNWKIFRNRRGTPRWYQRLYEAALIVTGKHSLHRAWQLGLDSGSASEYRRLITNRAYLAEVAHGAPLLDKSAINAEFTRLYELSTISGKHGHYENMFAAMHLAYAPVLRSMLAAHSTETPK